ncbi:MAG: hypothetical protein KAX31_06255, partial [Thermoplasmata archaeon]|nr:hypothetical protein [Thermoplasmata archaeon]
KPISLSRLQRTGIVEQGQLIPRLMAYALPEGISLYKEALWHKPDKHMGYLISMFEEEGHLKWKEVLEKSPLSYRSTLDAKKRLTSGLFVLRDAENRYYLSAAAGTDRMGARKEVLKGIIHQFGIFSAEHLSLYTKGEFRMGEIRRVLRELEDEGTLVKGFLLEDSERLHWVLGADLDRLFRPPGKMDVVLTSEDRLAWYLLPRTQRKLGIGSSWVMIHDCDIIGAARVQRRKDEFPVKGFIGSQDAWNLLKAHAIQLGKRLRKVEDDAGKYEDHEEWYERYLRPTTVK